MKHATFATLVLALLCSCCGLVVFADEGDELRERARALQKEASALAERGNTEEAERLQQRAAELLESAERMKGRVRQHRGPERAAGEREARFLETRLRELMTRERELHAAQAPQQELAELREQIARTERELRGLREHHRGEPALPPDLRPQLEKLAAAERRIHHVRVAAENLKAAEFHDLARELLEQAEGMERKLHEARQRLDEQMHHAHHGDQERGLGVVQELQAEIERLRAEVRELRQNAERR